MDVAAVDSGAERAGRGKNGVFDRLGGRQPQPPSKKHDNKMVCRHGNKCKYSDKCRFIHNWFHGESFAMLAHLPGHDNAITGIVLGSDKLFSGGKDESLRVWDCQSGECEQVFNLGAQIGCVITHGPWLFIGTPNVVRVWNSQTKADLSLSGGAVGQVHALAVGNNGMLFAGTQDGTILAWVFNADANCFQPAAALKAHDRAVVSLLVQDNTLFSGSMDSTIRVWCLNTLKCIQTLTDHTSVVMSLLFWERFLLSCSLDGTVKVWTSSENASWEVTYTHEAVHGVLGLYGMQDAESKPILMCCCNNNVLYLYDLPSFNEHGRIFTKEEVRAVEVAPGGLFFTGDGSGDLRVWKWCETAATKVGVVPLEPVSV